MDNFNYAIQRLPNKAKQCAEAKAEKAFLVYSLIRDRDQS